jgi:hypothetical protein
MSDYQVLKNGSAPYSLWLLTAIFFCSTVTMMVATQHVSVLVAVALVFLCLQHSDSAVPQRTAAVQDPAFVGAGTEGGLLIWRIEVSCIPFTVRSLCS